MDNCYPRQGARQGTVVCFYTELKEEEEDNNQPIVTVHRWMD